MTDLSQMLIKEVIVEKLNEDIYSVFLVDDSGEKGKAICGHPKKGHPKIIFKHGIRKALVCQKPPGAGTPNDFGWCSQHIENSMTDKTKNFYELAKFYSEGSSLGDTLEDLSNTEIKLTDVSNEIRLLTGLQLHLIRWIEENQDENGESWTPTRIAGAASLLKDIIRAKETAARIEGSMRIELSELRQVVEMIMGYLVRKLTDLKIPKELILEIMEGMTTEVFTPMTNKQMISDKKNILNLKLDKEELEVEEINAE